MMGSADRWRKVRLDFSICLSFPLISSHSGPLAGLEAGLEADSGVDLPGWRAGWERLVLARFPDIWTPCRLSGGLDLVCVSRRDVPGLTGIMVGRCIRGWEVGGVSWGDSELGVRSVELVSGEGRRGFRLSPERRVGGVASTATRGQTDTGEGTWVPAFAGKTCGGPACTLTCGRGRNSRRGPSFCRLPLWCGRRWLWPSSRPRGGFRGRSRGGTRTRGGAPAWAPGSR